MTMKSPPVENPVPPAVAPTIELDGTAPMPVLDTADGLKRSMGREALYARTLASFVRHFAASAQKARAALAGADHETLCLTTHSLKGAAGQIGATALQAIAARVEADARDHADPRIVSAGIDALQTALDTLLEAIAAHEASRRPDAE